MNRFKMSFRILERRAVLRTARPMGWLAATHPTNLSKIRDDISNFIPVWAAVVGMIVGGIDIIMLLSDWYLERREKRVQTAKDEGIAEGQAKVYREIAEWDRRRKEAEARGETFTEPPPAPPEKQSEK